MQDFGNTLSSGDFEMIAFSWIGTPFPFRGVQQLYGNGSDSNFGYSDIPELDPLIDQLATTVDDDRAGGDRQPDRRRSCGSTVTRSRCTSVLSWWRTGADLANFGAFGFRRR